MVFRAGGCDVQGQMPVSPGQQRRCSTRAGDVPRGGGSPGHRPRGRSRARGHRVMVSETTPMVLAEGHSTRWLRQSALLKVLEAADVDNRVRSAATTIYQA